MNERGCVGGVRISEGNDITGGGWDLTGRRHGCFGVGVGVGVGVDAGVSSISPSSCMGEGARAVAVVVA